MKGLDISSRMPSEMQDYIENYGFHFSKKACDYALRDLKKDGSPVTPMTKEQADEMFKKYNVTLKNNVLYDAVYKLAYEKCNHFGKSLPNEQMLAMHVQEDLDAMGNTGEEVFREWIADRIGQGNPIDWYSIL